MSKRAWENCERECAAKRRRVGKTKTATPPQSLLVQGMSTVPNRLISNKHLDTRDVVDFSGYLFDKKLTIAASEVMGTKLEILPCQRVNFGIDGKLCSIICLQNDFQSHEFGSLDI